MTKKSQVFDVKEFGAYGDGRKTDTAAIQHAIDTCGEAGGGTVSFPPGNYRAGSLFLRDNITLYLEKNACLQQSADMADYRLTDEKCLTHTTGSRFVFLHGRSVYNVKICGEGKIDGMAVSDDIDGETGRGPLPILFENSEHICLENVEVCNSTAWSITFFGCNDAKILRVRVVDSGADGIDLVCCQNVLLDGVHIEGSGDDAICIKNESAGHLFETRPDCGFLTENIIIANTEVLKSRWEHPGIKIGTGTAGIFRSIIVHDCIFSETGAVFCIQLMRPGMRGVSQRRIQNICFHRITARNCKCLIDISQMDVMEPVISDISMENIRVESLREPSAIHGMENAPVRNISLKQIRFNSCGTNQNMMSVLWAEYVENLTISGWELQGLFSAAVQLKNCKNVNAGDMIHPDREFPLLLIEGEKSQQILFQATEREKNAVILRDDVPKDAFSPQVTHFHIREMKGPTAVPAGEGVRVEISICNAGEAGIWQGMVRVNGRPDGMVRVWLDRYETKTLEFVTKPVYGAGICSVEIGSERIECEIEVTPADIRLCPSIEILNAAGRAAFFVEAFNFGGSRGEGSTELRCGEALTAQENFSLDPGQKIRILLQANQVCRTGEAYRIPGIMEWSYRVAANTYARFTTKGNRISIAAGGRQYSESGDLEKSQLKEYAAVYRQVKGDFSAVVRLVSQQPSGQYAFAGLIVCNNMSKAEEGEGIAILSNSPKYGSIGIWRADCNGDGLTEKQQYLSCRIGDWIQIVKTGNSAQAFYSRDGKQWENGKSYKIPAAKQVQDVGIFVYANSSHNEIGGAEFEDFIIKPLTD